MIESTKANLTKQNKKPKNINRKSLKSGLLKFLKTRNNENE